MNRKLTKISNFSRHQIRVSDFQKLLGIKDEIENIEIISHVTHQHDGVSREEFVEITLRERLSLEGKSQS